LPRISGGSTSPCYRNDTITGIYPTFESIRGEIDTFLSVDRIVDHSGRAIFMYPPEYLNTIEVTNLLHHEFKVKVGAPVMISKIVVRVSAMELGYVL
jgi:hypothetical protein